MKNHVLIKICRALATGLYSGYLHPIPGTFGSLALLAIWYLAQPLGYPRSMAGQSAMCLLLFVGGFFCTRYVLKNLDPAELTQTIKKHDPSFIVIDEWAGMLISLIGVQDKEYFKIICAFALFRFFDIIKLPPVRWAERFQGAWGVMLDDVVAGLFASAVLTVAFHWLA